MRPDSYLSASAFYKKLFGTKIYKIAVDVGCTCPTRDGTKDTRGCIFCSGRGSGDFAPSAAKSISEQIAEAKLLVNAKLKGRSGKTEGKYIAYFQNFTNTYGNPDLLLAKYEEALAQPDVAGLAIATRPDCISDRILAGIKELSEKHFVSIELGLQTIKPESVSYIRRGYANEEYIKAVKSIRETSPAVHIVTHVIFGLPGETKEDMLNTVRWCTQGKNAIPHGEGAATEASLSEAANLIPDKSLLSDTELPPADCLPPACDGIKFTVLHVLEGTDLAEEWRKGLIKTLDMKEYFDIVCSALKGMPPEVVVHRLTGDGPKKILLAPMWTADKKKVLNSLNKYLKAHSDD